MACTKVLPTVNKMIGIDIVNIDRIKSRHDLFRKIFSSKELKETNKYNLYTKIEFRRQPQP